MAKWIPDVTGSLDCASGILSIDFRGGGGVRYQKLTDDRGGFGFILNDTGASHSTVSGIESRKVHCTLTAISKSTYTDAFGLEVFQRPGNVQEALASGADDGDWCPSQFSQVG